jgi:hypothetical protein
MYISGERACAGIFCEFSKAFYRVVFDFTECLFCSARFAPLKGGRSWCTQRAVGKLIDLPSPTTWADTYSSASTSDVLVYDCTYDSTS